MASRSKNETDYDYLFKILIIGDSGVGYVCVCIKHRDVFASLL